MELEEQVKYGTWQNGPDFSPQGMQESVVATMSLTLGKGVHLLCWQSRRRQR